jgi:hypothetical protein
MTAGLYSYFQLKPLDRFEFSEYSASYHNLISLQELISWGHFLRGKISKEWSNLQQDYVSRNSPSTKFDKEKWLRLIIKPLIMDSTSGLYATKKDTAPTRLPNSPSLHHKPAETYAPSTFSAMRSLHPTAPFSRNHSTPFFSTALIPFNAGSDHTNQSSTKADVKPNATPRPTCACYQPTSTRYPAIVPIAAKTLVPSPQPNLHSAPQECQTTTPTSPPAPRQSRELYSKTKSSYATFSSFPSSFPTLQRNLQPSLAGLPFSLRRRRDSFIT